MPVGAMLKIATLRRRASANAVSPLFPAGRSGEAITEIVHYQVMTHDLALSRLHPMGDQSAVADHGLPPGINLDSFAGPVHVEWDAEAALTPLGQLPFFIDFLKGRDYSTPSWRIARCVASPNAPKKRDVLGTTMLSMLSGHKRYAHIAALRGDGVLPELLDMNKIVSEDAVRRASRRSTKRRAPPGCAVTSITA